MKKIILFILAMLLFNTSWAQDAPPEMFKFQAYINKPNGNPVMDKTVGVEIAIYQSAINGTLVYSEEFAPTTNKIGLINLEIGNGNPTHGLFSAILWEAGEFFLQLSADIDGGTNYTSMGASQLLSVPYALFAKKAMSVEGDNDTDPTNEIEMPVEDGTEGQILTTDGEGTVSWQTPEEASLEALLIKNNDGGENQIKNIANPSDGQDAVTKTYVDDLIAALNARITALEPPQIGDFHYGGVIFYIFQPGDPGYVEDETHGLVCAIEDQTIRIQWYNGDYEQIATTGTAIGTGSSNTDDIIAALGPGTYYAAGLAKAYAGGGHIDWFLPSKDELNEMYLNKVDINAAATANGGENLIENYYWSSTEFSRALAWGQNFSNGNQSNAPKERGLNVRAVRAF